jgi:hypothetical protein
VDAVGNAVENAGLQGNLALLVVAIHVTGLGQAVLRYTMEELPQRFLLGVKT